MQKKTTIWRCIVHCRVSFLGGNCYDFLGMEPKIHNLDCESQSQRVERQPLFSIFPPKNLGLTKVHPRKCSHVSPEKGAFQKGNAGFQPAFFNRYVSSLEGTVRINKNPTPLFFQCTKICKTRCWFWPSRRSRQQATWVFCFVRCAFGNWDFFCMKACGA